MTLTDSEDEYFRHRQFVENERQRRRGEKRTNLTELRILQENFKMSLEESQGQEEEQRRNNSADGEDEYFRHRQFVENERQRRREQSPEERLAERIEFRALQENFEISLRESWEQIEEQRRNNNNENASCWIL